MSRLFVGLHAFALAVMATAMAAAQPPLAATRVPQLASPPQAKAAELLKLLDSDRYDARRRAVAELTDLAANLETANWLARECQRLLREPATSFEVRVQLNLLAAKLPAPARVPANEVADGEAQRLLDLLDDRSYAVRIGAEKRLQWLASETAHARLLLDALEKRSADSGLSPDSRARLVALEETARGSWLASDPATWRLPDVADAQIEIWIDELVKAAATRPETATERQLPAAHRLLDLMARDEYVPRTAKLLQARLNDRGLPPAASGPLHELLDWTKPALVAEIWQFQKHSIIQHLLVNVPRQADGAEHPSHFDRIDDRTAHCVSGNNLVPGDYPVGVAVAHPTESKNWMCHLVNLPTPRRRMLYDYSLKVDEAVRLRGITERTMQAYLRDKKPLTDLEIVTFDELDAATIGKYAGPYFKAVDDRKGMAGPYAPGGENASHHNRICAKLAEMGTKEAGLGLVEALAAKRFLPASAETDPYVWSWIAALAIAKRDPWPGVDRWLASLIVREDPLYAGEPLAEEPVEPDDGVLPRSIKAPRVIPPPELGATAAAMLLERHDADPNSYGIDVVSYEMLEEFGLTPSRFQSPQRRLEVLRWWKTEQLRADARQGP